MKCSSFFSPLQVAQVLLPLPEHVLHLRGTPSVPFSHGILVASEPRPPHPSSEMWAVMGRDFFHGPPSRPPASHSSGLISHWRPHFSCPAYMVPELTPTPSVTSLGPQPANQLIPSLWSLQLIQRLTHDPRECPEIHPRTFVETIRKGPPSFTEVTKFGAAGPSATTGDSLPENEADTKVSGVRDGDRLLVTWFKHLDPAVPEVILEIYS